MKYAKKVMKLLGFIIVITLASVGMGINAALMPSFRRQNSKDSNIEMVESKEEESE